MIEARRDRGLGARLTRVISLGGVPGGPAVGAGSALVRVGDRLLAVSDDALAAAWIDPRTGEVTPLVLAGRGERLPKSEKPDFESALVDPDGTLYILGSGGTARRRHVVRVDLRRGAVDWLDRGALYDAVAVALGGRAPNIEGAVLRGAVVTLFHRANGHDAGPSVTLDVPRASLDGGDADVLATRVYDLGRVGGVALTFTDAALLDGGRALYLAAAEDSRDAVLDGPILGAAVGVLDGAGARYAWLTEADGSPSARKVEGVALDDDGRGGHVITDPDDDQRPAELCRLVLEGDWT